jgi:hypothetical protein
MITNGKKGDKVRCIDALGMSYISKGHIYELVEDQSYGDVRILDNENDVGLYTARRFEFVEPVVQADVSYVVNRADGLTDIQLRGKFTNEQVSAILAIIQ